VVRVFRLNREQVRARLDDWARSLGADDSVLHVVLFGSFARGDATAASDADVLIVLKDSALRFRDRILQYQPSGLGVGVDVFPYTLDEARRSLEEGWGVAGVALAEGESLYAAPGAPSLEHQGRRTRPAKPTEQT
jgi:predicted nucleotidyltransferase